MICRKCGHHNEDGVLFCEACKEDLDAPLNLAAPLIPVNDFLPQDPPPLAPIDDIPVLEPVLPEPPLVHAPIVPPAVPPPIPSLLSEPVVSHYSETLPLTPPSVTIDTPPPAHIAPETVAPPVVSAPPVVTGSADVTAAFTPVGRKPKLVVIRGLRIDAVYPLWEGTNYLGRTDDQPVDIDLDDQESPDRIWSSRQHAIIHMKDGKLTIEDLKSMNGTFVNRVRVHPGENKELAENDVVQVGTVHMKVVFS